MQIELVVGSVALFVILSIAGFMSWILFKGGDIIETKVREAVLSNGYPVKVPGWGARLAETPPFQATSEDVGRALQLILKHALTKGYNEDEVKKKLNSSVHRFVRADPAYGDRRAVVDPWGRSVHKKDAKGRPMFDTNGLPVKEPMLVGGWHLGDQNFVVFLPSDNIEDTALVHENGHGLQDLKGVADYDHKDTDVFGSSGIVETVRRELRSERTGEDLKEPLDDGLAVGTA